MNHSFRLLIILLFLIPSPILYSQWISTYGHAAGDNQGDEQAYSIAVGNSGDVYVTGYSDAGSRGTDICTIKYSSGGDTLWVRNFNGNGNGEDKAYAIVVDSFENIYVAGYCTALSDGTDMVLLKYDSEGNLIWSKTYNGGGSQNDKAYAIVIDTYGNIIITGYVSSAMNYEDCCTVKYSPSGDLQWASTYDGAGHNTDQAVSAAVTSNNDIVITGWCMTGSTTSSEDIITIKYDGTTGSADWINIYNGPGGGSDKAYAIVVDSFNEIYLTGYTESALTEKDIVTISYDDNGNEGWVELYDSYGYDDLGNAIAVSGTDVAVTGLTSHGSHEMTQDYITLNYSTDGRSAGWASIYDGPGNNTDYATSLAFSPLGDAVYVTGVSQSANNPGSKDMFTVKYDVLTGTILDSARYSTGSNNADYAMDIAVDMLGNVYITGYSLPVLSDNYGGRFITAKYSNGKLSGNNGFNNTPSSYKLFQNYPNPFNPSTLVKFDILKEGNVALKVYDVTGREVKTLINENMSPGSYSITINLNDYSSGVYFYKLTANSFSDVKKMILMK